MSDKQSFINGAIWAAARLIEMHDEPTMASEIVKELQASRTELRECAEYDLAILRPHIKGLPRQGR